MNYPRIVLYAVVAVLVALLAGFLWGRSGRSTIQTDLQDTEMRLDLAEARSAVLGARVDLFEVNFGRASQQLQVARARLQDAGGRLTDANKRDDANRVKEIAARVAHAQDQAGRLDQSANTTLAGAVSMLDQVIGASGDGRTASSGRK